MSLENGEGQQFNKGYKPANIYAEAKKDSSAFLHRNSEMMKVGFERQCFIGPAEKANVAIIITAHNETTGSKAGNLESCLYAVSQQNIPEGFKVKVIVVAHNCNEEDKTADVLSLFPKIELVQYHTQLRGFSYPLQAGVLMLDEDEVSEIGIIDSDTVVNIDWINSMHETLNRDVSCGAVVGPREYLTNDGRMVPYGKVKHLLEKTGNLVSKLRPENKAIVKLVTGNSYYRYKQIREVIAEHIGEMITDGVIQTSLSDKSVHTTYNERGFAVSNGDKFAHYTPLELSKAIVEKARISFFSQSVYDHIEFMLFELASYFPEFGRMVSSYVVEYSEIKAANNEEMANDLYKRVTEAMNKFNSDNKGVIEGELARLISERMKNK